jgi:hypothetical protein
MTFDGWSKKRRKAFESLTVHFIQSTANNPFEWKLHAHLLTFDRRKGRHTGEENGKHLANTIQQYDFVAKVSPFCYCLHSGIDEASLLLGWLVHE